MFGLEKKKTARFEFDLEKELKSNPTKLHQAQKDVEAKILEIKNQLRQGTGSADFDNLGVLLHGYAALQRVLKRMASKK